MLDRSRDDVAAARVAEGNALDREIVTFGAAARDVTSPGRQPSERATLRRASSSAAAAASPTWWWLDGLPKPLVSSGHMASRASWRTGVVAALSR